MTAMEAGRELDALIAEKVMGWERHSNVRGLYWWTDAGDTVHYPEEWMPSTDISAAWKVWEHITETDPTWGILTRVEKGIRRYDVGQRLTASYEPDVWIRMGIAETAPLAICLAALKAVGVDTEVAVT